jgi:hypothetical protein
VAVALWEERSAQGLILIGFYGANEIGQGGAFFVTVIP